MNESKFENDLLRKLDDIATKIDTLIQLVAFGSQRETILKGRTKKEQIKILSRLGLSRNVIALLVGTTPETVSVRISEMKKKKKKMERK